MRKRVGTGRGSAALRIALAAPLLLLLGVPPARGAGGLVTGSYNLNLDSTMRRSDTGSDESWSLKQSINLKYRAQTSGVANIELGFRADQEYKPESDPSGVTRLNPTLDIGLKGSSWTAGAKSTIDTSDEPDKNPHITDSYFVEYFFTPPKTSLPDLKAKYTLDHDFEAELTNTLKQNLTLSSQYKPTDAYNFRVDYTKGLADNRISKDADTEDVKYSVGGSLRFFPTERIRYTTDVKVDLTKGATLLDDGGKKNPKDDVLRSWKNKVDLKTLKDTDLGGAFDADYRSDNITGDESKNFSFRVDAGQKLLRLDLKGSFSRTVTKDFNHVDPAFDEKTKTEDNYTFDAKTEFRQPLLDLTYRWQKKDTQEEFEDPGRDTSTGSITQSVSWSPAIPPFTTGSVSFTRTDSFQEEERTSISSSWSFSAAFDYKPVSLTISPTYGLTFTEDLLSSPSVENTTRDLKVKVAWTGFRTAKAEGKFDHTYGRKSDTAAGNVERTDSTTVNFILRDPAPGWSLGFDWTRAGTDRSEDDQPPDVSWTYGAKADYTYLMFRFNTSYKYDMKTTGDDKGTFDVKTSWDTQVWRVELTFKFDKTYSEALDESYTTALAFAYNF